MQYAQQGLFSFTHSISTPDDSSYPYKDTHTRSNNYAKYELARILPAKQVVDDNDWLMIIIRNT